ncbi:MAG: TolC family protein [Psychroflexus halocasei]
MLYSLALKQMYLKKTKNNMNLIKQIYKSSIVTFSILISCLTNSNAQNKEVLATKVTLQECREMALKNNIQINVAKEKITAAEYKMAAYKANYLPKISATSLYIYNDASLEKNIKGGELPVFVPDGTGEMIPSGGFAFLPDIPLELNLNRIYNAGIKLEQPIYTGGKINAAYRMAQKSREMAQANQNLTKVEIIVLSDKAYWNSVKVKALIVSANLYKETLKELLRIVQNAVDEGMAHRKELLTVQVKLNEAELNLTRAQNGYKLAIMNLNHTIGLPLNNPTEVSNSFDEHDLKKFLEEPTRSLQKFDITLRPEYALLSKQIELKKEQEKLVKSDFLPNIGIMGMFGYTNGFKLNGNKVFDNANFSAILSVNIPIFSWGEGKNKIKEAELQKTIAEMEFTYAKQEMTLEVTKAINDLNEAKLEVLLSSKSLEQAIENMNLSKDRYNAGMELLSDYMEAQALWQNAMSNLIAAQASYQLSKTKYLKSTGKL